MKIGLVLEGGGSRGVFTSGVLDLLLQENIAFNYCVGVSAGAGNAMCFKSRQKGRAFSLLGSIEGSRYYGLTQARKSKSFVNLHLLYHTLSESGPFPFDFQAYRDNPMECEFVLTCCETGQAEYFREEYNQTRLQNIVMASCSLPGFCPPVSLDGKHYLDGGVADAMPVQRALDNGCDKVLLITTKPPSALRPMDYRKMRLLMEKLYRKKYPALFHQLMTRADRYFTQLQEILELEQKGIVYVLRPDRCPLKMLDTDPHKLREYYNHGRAVGKEHLPALLEFLR